MQVLPGVHVLRLLAPCVASHPALAFPEPAYEHPLIPRFAGVCPSDCSNNGFCYNATCHCNPGWKGGDCSFQTCPDECNYHGSCKSGTCVCRPGWDGVACETRTCPNECSMQGTCVNFKCQCRFGFTGFDCASLACPRDCSGKGSCYNGAPPIHPLPHPPTHTGHLPRLATRLHRHVLLLPRLARHRLLVAHLPQRLLIQWLLR